MTRLEWIRQMPAEQLTKYLCWHLECAWCPAQDLCRKDHTGLIEWFAQEVPEEAEGQ